MNFAFSFSTNIHIFLIKRTYVYWIILNKIQFSSEYLNTNSIINIVIHYTVVMIKLKDEMKYIENIKKFILVITIILCTFFYAKRIICIFTLTRNIHILVLCGRNMMIIKILWDTINCILHISINIYIYIYIYKFIHTNVIWTLKYTYIHILLYINYFCIYVYTRY